VAEFADVAVYQRGLDVGAYARAGYDRILVKASEGTSYVNPLFAVWWAAAGALGLARGAYHYAKPSRWSGAAEADHFHRTLRAAGGLGPQDWVCLDVEEPGQEHRAAAHAAGFCERMVELGYREGVVYSGTYYLGPAGLTADRLPEGWRRLHLANYNPVGDSRVPLPPGWPRERLVARQYTSTASQPGIPGRSDANRVVREWLDSRSVAEVEEPVTEQDKKDIAREVVDLLMRQVREDGVEDKANPPTRQKSVGALLRSTNNKTGWLQRAVDGTGGVSDRLGLVGAAVAAAREEIAVVGGKVDALTAVAGTEPVTGELLEMDPSPVEHMLAVLLDHLGVEYPPTAPAPPEPHPEALREEPS
jgi:lysozyme